MIDKSNYEPTDPLPQQDPYEGRDRTLTPYDPTGRNQRNGPAPKTTVLGRLITRLAERLS